jgi:peptidoglycan hydrolase CwlO-like protein
MPAILKSKHDRFCNRLENIKVMPIAPDQQLDRLQMEIESIYSKYQLKMEELKDTIAEYKQKQKAIQYEIKRNRKYNFFLRNERPNPIT